MPSTLDWPSGYGPPPEPPPRDYTDDRLRNRFEACRSGMQELNALRTKHALLIQNLRSRLPIIPGCIDDVQTRDKKQRDSFLDRFSLQSVDSGISSQNTINSTRSSSPDDYKHQRHSNIYENSSNNNNGSTMNYSTFRKLSLEQKYQPQPKKSDEAMTFQPPIITSRSCHRGAWKTSPQRVRPKSMFDTSTTEYLYEKPPRHPIDLSKDRRSAFTVISSQNKRHSVDPAAINLSQLSLNDDYRCHNKPIRTAQKPEVVRRSKEKADAMFRANLVYAQSTSSSITSSPEQPIRSVRFSPARSPPVRRSQPIELPSSHFAIPCNIRSPKLTKCNVFAARPIAVSAVSSPKIQKAQQHSTWLQSQPL